MSLPFRILTLTLISLAGCPEPVTPPPPSACKAACAKLEEFACPEGDTPVDGQPCEAVCERAERFHLGLRPDCVAASTSREMVQACGVECEQ